MDFKFDLVTNLWKMPRGIERKDGVNNKLTWKAKYGSVVATAFDLIATDGMNEKGLVGNILWLAESNYGNPAAGDTQLSMAIWLQYYLDNFATVAQAVKWTEQTQVEIKQLFDPTGHLVPTLHLALSDANGDSAIIEYIDGKPIVHHSKDYLVMTNSPSYDQQLELVKEFEGLGGDAPLPGTNDARDRFARASYYVKHQEQPKNRLHAMAAMFSIIRNCAQPFRTPDAGKPDASQTIWQVVADSTNKIYSFESTTHPNIVWVDFAKISFKAGSKIEKLDLVSELALEGGLAGDVSEKFEDPGEDAIGLVNTGVEALNFVAKKQKQFEQVSGLVSAFKGKFDVSRDKVSA
jgi:choloylglycine hydrolase